MPDLTFTGNATSLINTTNQAAAALQSLGTQLDTIGKVTQNFARDVNTGMITPLGTTIETVDALGNKIKALRDASNQISQIQLTTVDPNIQLTKALRGTTANDLAANFKRTLGGISSSFTQQGVLNIERASVALQKLYVNSSLTEDRMNQLFLAIKNGSVAALGTLTIEEQRATIALRQLSKSFDQATDAGVRTQEVMINFRTALRIIAIQQLHLIISKITQALIGNQKAANDFGIKIAEIQTITQKANLSTEQWSSSLVTLSNSFGTDLIQTASAAYEAASNQIAKGAGVTVFLADAFDLARTTGATAEQSVNILSSAINAYGGAAFEATRLSAILFKVADLGRVRVGEMANTFGNTATLANALGINIKELGASIATLTIQGIRYDTSATLVNNIILKLIKPTAAMKDLFDQWGVSSGQAAIATYGFSGVLQRLGQELASGGLSRIGDLESDLRAIRSVVGQTGGNSFEIWTKAFSEMTNAQDEFSKASEITANTVSFKLNKEAAAVHNLFVATASTELNKVILELSENTGGFANNLKPIANTLINLVKIFADFSTVLINFSRLTGITSSNISTIVPSIVAMFGAYKAGTVVLASLNIAQGFFNTLIQRGTWLLVSQGIAEASVTKQMALRAAVTAGLTAATTSLSVATAALTFGIPILIGALTYGLTTYYETQRNVAASASDTEAMLNAASQKNLSDFNKTIDRENQAFKEGIDTRFRLFNQYIAAVRTVINAGNLSQLKEALDPITEKLQGRNFDIRLISANEEKRLGLVQERIGVLAKQAQALQLAGKLDEAAAKFKELEDASKDFTDSTTRGLDRVTKELSKLNQERENKAFENSLAGLTDPQKIKRTLAYIEQLRQKSKDFQEKGLFGDARQESEEASKLAQKLIALSESVKKKAGGGKVLGADIADKLLQDRISIATAEQNKLKELQAKAIENEKNVVDQTINGINRQTAAVKALGEEYNKIQKTLKEISDAQTGVSAKRTTAEQDLTTNENAFASKVSQLAQGLKASIGFTGHGEATATSRQQFNAMADAVVARVNSLSKIDINDPNRKAVSDEILKDLQTLRTFLNGKNLGNVQTTDVSEKKVGTSQDTFAQLSATISQDFVKLKQAREDRQKILDEQNEMLRIQLQLTNVSNDINERAAKLVQAVPGALEALRNQLPQAADSFRNSVEGIRTSAENMIKALQTLQQLQQNNQNPQQPKQNLPNLGFNGNNRVNGLASNGPSINVGDINVNLSGNNNEQNAREVARQIQRQIRFGNSRLS